MFREAEASAASAKRAFQPVIVGGVVPPGVVPEITLMDKTAWNKTTWERQITPRDHVTEPLTIYILGKFTYSDVFPGTPRHTTKFCLMRETGISFGVCPNGNWMN